MASSVIYRTEDYKVEVCAIPVDADTTETRYFLDDLHGKNLANHTDKSEILALADAMQALK
tara:strand:- start:454 stop:636 length:183 start_codon:yes stop_codon:yes gene_type:complete